MLTLKECKQYINNPCTNEEKLELVRNFIYNLVERIIDAEINSHSTSIFRTS